MRVGAQDHEALDVLVVELDRAVHAVGERGLSRRHLEADRAAVFEGLSARQQLARGGAVAIEPLRLEVRRMRAADFGALIPVDAEPAQAVENAGDHLGLRALDVGVFDAKDEGAAVTAGVEPVEQRRAGAADVEVAGGGGREAKTRHLGIISDWWAAHPFKRADEHDDVVIFWRFSVSQRS